MKKTILTSVAALMLFSVSYAKKEKKVKSKVKAVTVYLQGAQVKRKGSFKLQSGITKIIFEGMSKSLDKNSIQVKGKGDFIILDVSLDLFYPEPKPVLSSVSAAVLRKKRLLKDSIETQKWINREINDKLSAYKLEKDILMGSLVIKGQTANDSIVALKDAMDYLREKLKELNPLISQISRKKQKQSHLMKEMNQRLSELDQYIKNSQQKPKKLQPIQQVIVTVSADREVGGALEVNYMVPNASWSPSYDLRADDINSPVELTYKAKVYQNSGENWENVVIKLSTINPNRSNYKPYLATWYLNYYRPITNTDLGYGSNLSNAKELSSIDYQLNEDVPMSSGGVNKSKMEAKHMDNFTQMSENIIMTEFELKLPYTIPSDGKPHMMAIGKEDIDATFEHYIVPKLDKDAFLMARLTDWEELNLLPGLANIYYDGTYVGQTRINPAVMSDTLDLALGRDKGIFVTRKKLNDDEKLRVFTNEKLRTITYEISLKNFKSTEIHVKIEDHIPIAQDQEIKIELIENETADYNKETGVLKWDKSIEGKETVKYLFTYTIKYNKDKTLAVN